MSQESEFKQMEILVEAVTTLTNNQFELLDTIKVCGERINILVERPDIHMNIIDDLRLQVNQLESFVSMGDMRADFDEHTRTQTTIHSMARKARQRDDS